MIKAQRGRFARRELSIQQEDKKMKGKVLPVIVSAAAVAVFCYVRARRHGR